jgi:hypothetical protein
MASLNIKNGLVLLALVVFTPALGIAQEAAHTLQDLQSSIRTSDIVRVEEFGGNRFQGKVESVSGTSLRIRIKGVSREFHEPEILLVRKQYRDSIRNGLLTGAAIGGAAGAIIGAVVSDAFCDGCGNFQAGGALAIGALGAGIGAGSGALGDWLRKGYKTVFSMPQTTNIRFNVSPLLSKTTRGVSVAFRF